MSVAVQLQDRDIGLLVELAQVGLLDTDQIHGRHFAAVSLRRCQQRLQRLQRQGLIHSVSLTVWYGQRGGQVPTIHSLTERGAEMIADHTGFHPRRFLRNEPKPETLHHRLAIVRSRLAMDDACRALGLDAPEWIMEQDRRPDAEANEAPSRQRILYHEFSVGDKKWTCQPDAACRMKIPRAADQPGAGTTPLVVFWEVDRSTERTGQVVGKCAGYAALLDRHAYRRYWPDAEQAPVRVFWVCRSQRRVESLIVALSDQRIAQCFRFTTAAELSADAALTLPIWQTIGGERREILRLPPAINLAALEPISHPTPHLPPHVGP